MHRGYIRTQGGTFDSFKPCDRPALPVRWLPIRPPLLSVLLIALCHVVPVHAADKAAPAKASESASRSSSVAPSAEEINQSEVIWEWDPYYTDVAVNIPLTSKPIPTIASDSEVEIYSKLIEGSIIPRYMLLEASVYPMPILGTYLKSHTPGFYRQGQIGGSSINVFETVTAGFQEPWAISAFFGNIAKLVRPGERGNGTNLGYTGYLISAGSKHIKDNVLIDDDWYELEWKIKGKRDHADEKMGWSFRFGWKFNANADVTDVKYFSIHRSNLDHRAPFLHWMKNTTFDLKVQFSHHGGQMVREEFMIGKKYPVSGRDYTTSLDVGFVRDSPDEYSGSLRDRNKSSVTLLIRPSIEF